jgi:iron complex outermembrane receptor protein
LRITRSRDIRAPNLNELYAAGSSNSDSVSNPFGAGSGPNGGNYGTNISYSAVALGNPNLRPEKANSWNIGAVLSPRFLPGFNFSADYFRIDMKDAIDTLGAQDIINRCKDGRPEYCAAITQDPNNATRILFRTQPFNFARKLVRGIDFEGSYRVPLDSVFKNASSFTLRGMATRYIENISDPGIPGNSVVSSVGTNGGQTSTPTWIFRFSATLDMPTTSVTAVARGVSAGKYFSSGIVCSTGCPTNTTTTTTYQTYDENHVSGLFYVDLNLTQNIKINTKSDAQFFVNVTNIFNRWPLLVPETGLAANSTYSDMLGRTFRIGLRIQLR